MQYFISDIACWDNTLEQILVSYYVYASVFNDYGQDYEILTKERIPLIAYNVPKPATPLKNFFLPVKENVAEEKRPDKQRIIIGVPNCDLEGLNLLDEIYLDPEFSDPFYRNRRKNTLLITSDCLTHQKHCHCTSYGIKPYDEGKGDISLFRLGDNLILTVFSDKGEKFLNDTGLAKNLKIPDLSVIETADAKHAESIHSIGIRNALLPDYFTTGNLLQEAKEDIWKKHASACVSCGACAVICPTCSCFLLIDRPGFEKIKQQDACQYPGFERVAGGEDALRRLAARFRNRYMCKYVWKPEKFSSIACTGCGRCIESCIGKINKNELIMELTN